MLYSGCDKGVTHMAVTVSTTQYQMAHGKHPRGDGSWAFFFGNGKVCEWFNGPYGKAKVQAVAYAKEHGYTFVSVGS